MYLGSITLAAAMSVVALSAQSATLSFDQPDLVAGVVDAGLTTVDVTKGGVTMTTVATNGGAVDVYNSGGGAGLYIGSITSGPINTNTNTSAPASGSYGFEFSQAITSISFVFDWLTNSTHGEEVLSMFSTSNGGISLAAANFTNLSGTSLDSGAQTINTNVGRGQGSVTYTGADFTGFYFDHTQDPQNIGFTVTNVSVELGLIRRMRRKSA